jgi:F0F1-type ATP synthase assembly protein I
VAGPGNGTNRHPWPERPAHDVAFLLPGVSGGRLSNLEVQMGRRQALAVVLGQVLLGAVVATACLAGWGTRAAESALVGAGIGTAATALMAFAMLRHGDEAGVGRVALSFFSGWLVKVLFTVAALVVALRSPKVEAVPLIAGYAATFFGYWFAAARVGARNTKRTVGVAD